VNFIKANLARRSEAVPGLLEVPARPVKFDAANTARLTEWQFKSSNTSPASGRKAVVDGSEVLQVQARGQESAGSWRAQILLEEGRYAFTGRARTDGFGSASATGSNGVLLRVSGEKSPQGSVSSKWTTLRYEFEVGGIADVELVCEFRGSQGSGLFDPGSMRLIRLERGNSPHGTPK
jgi:hypothetical protein